MKHTEDNKTLERIANSLESIAESLKELNRKAVDNNVKYYFEQPVLTEKGEKNRIEFIRNSFKKEFDDEHQCFYCEKKCAYPTDAKRCVDKGYFKGRGLLICDDCYSKHVSPYLRGKKSLHILVKGNALVEFRGGK